MRRWTREEDELIQYLLGDLPDKRRDEMEEHYFQDPALHETLLAVEEELIDSYARGELAEEQRLRF